MSEEIDPSGRLDPRLAFPQGPGEGTAVRKALEEINPAGEYLFISQRTGLPIPEAIAASLQRHDGDR